MKKILAVILTVVLMVSVCPFGMFTFSVSAATTGTTGDCTWSLDGTILTISGNGEMEDYYSSNAPWGQNITKVIIEDSVTSIGGCAFERCSSLTSVTIGNSVTSIGDYAFEGCSSLTSITIPDSVTSIGSGAFYGCSSLTSITIPDSVTSIGNYAFYDCTSLTSITIPDSVTSIGSGAFEYCSSLTSITVDSANKHYSSQDGVLFNKDKTQLIQYPIRKASTIYTIPDSVTSIGSDAFFGCSSLTSITIPDSVTSIGSQAFWGCSSLTSITIPDSVTSISFGAFSRCTSLTSITIPDSVTSIGDGAFAGCSSLESITVGMNNKTYHSDSNCLIETATKTLVLGCKNSVIPTDGSVTSIGEEAFYGCSSLTSITIPASVTSIGDMAFYDCSSLTSITIPASVTSIEYMAFYDCSSLTSITVDSANKHYSSQDGVLFNKDKTQLIQYPIRKASTTYTIPDSVTSISFVAFDGCSSLTSITIPDSVTSIDCGAFSRCSSLTSITIPDSVTSIDCEVFAGCSSLTSITIPDSVTSIGDGAFAGCSSLTSITIPDSVTSISYAAFDGCSSLTSITIPDSVTSIGSYAFYGCSSLKNVYFRGTVLDKENISFGSDNDVLINAVWHCFAKLIYDYNDQDLTATVIGIEEDAAEVVIPSTTMNNNKVYTVIAIGEQAFYKNVSIVSIEIPDTVMSIGELAFYKCTALVNVNIPDSVTSIGDYAFLACTKLESATIGEGVKNIGEGAFYDCVSLENVYFSGMNTDKQNISIGAENDILQNVEWHVIEEGDLTADWQLDILDIVTLQRYLAGWEGYGDADVNVSAADLNGDGKVDATDVLYLLKKLTIY